MQCLLNMLVTGSALFRSQSSCGLKLSDEAVRVAEGMRLGANICEPHTCACVVPVTTKTEHGLSCQPGFGFYRKPGFLQSRIHRDFYDRMGKDRMVSSLFRGKPAKVLYIGRHGHRHYRTVVPDSISRSVGSS